MKKVKYFRKYICIIAIVVGIAFAYKLELPIVIAIGVITTLLMPMLYKEEKKKIESADAKKEKEILEL